ncbi:sodium:solute symporter family protein [Pelagicoccus enzymogenes]|uniref:sodium:solute symporter family protein n=1 Tax=Pelagicoccus enzymogenes TaxID=2773457 RepID=UPI00280C67D1|nr:sodium:solute symporter family protein [Pelagicoccus enzymogenes]MDQ8199406.1 sodium:solute symporter family protein [Pelagicoccus enzymogenes]
MSENGIHIVDVVVVVAYLIGITLLGVWIGRSVKGTGDFFMPRRFGKGMMMMHAFGTGTASDQAVIVASGTFRNGLSGIWFQWLWLFNTPFYWLIAPIFRRLRAVTTADVYCLRFGSSVSILFALIGIIGLSVKIGLMLKGAGALIESGTGGALSAEWSMPLVAVLFVAYGTAGGLGAAIVTDYIQGILTVVFSFILLPSVLIAVGGLSGIRETVRSPEMLSMVAPEEINVVFIGTFALLSLVGIVAQPFIMGVCSAGRTEFDGRFGFVVGNLIKRVCTAAWALTGVGALAFYMQSGVEVTALNPDEIYGAMAQQFLPALLPGILGLFIAALLSGVMSSCDSFMISASGLFTENLYRPYVREKTEAHYLLVGRAVALGIVLGGILTAYLLPNVVAGLKLWLKIAPMLGIAFWIGLFWRRYNAMGAWVSTVTGFVGWWALSGTSLSEPVQILCYLGFASVAGILASLLSRPPSKEKVERFHALIRTPVLQGEEVLAPCQLPLGANSNKRATFLAGTNFEFPVPSRVSIVGFMLSSLAVAGMIYGFVWIMNW